MSIRDLLQQLNVSETDLAQLRANREYDEVGAGAFESAEAGEFETTSLTPEQIVALISEEATKLVIDQEIGDIKSYKPRPEWPGGKSGVTIGIGYDLGYNTLATFKENWAGRIPEAAIQQLSSAIDVKGNAARAIISNYANLQVPLEQAMKVYRLCTMARFGRDAINAFPHCEELPPDCFGALFSLVYNRGSGMKDNKPGDRQEMRNIRDLCKDRKFERIPAELRSMKRVWVGQNLRGLITRREAEALLFEAGLKTMMVASAAPAAPAGKGSFESTGSFEAAEALDPRFDGDGRFFDYEEAGPGTFEAADDFDLVKWPKDEESPDYEHILAEDRTALSGKTFNFDKRALELLIRASTFEPLREQNRIIFALRGAELVTALDQPKAEARQVDRAALTLRECRPDHRHFRCVIGAYNLETGTLSGFPASTVPCRRAVTTYLEKIVAGEKKASGNMVPTGVYRFKVGWHNVSHEERMVPGALTEAGNQKCVMRSTNNAMYDIYDTWDNAEPHGDNLHPSFAERSADFSSWGCLVVSGDYDPRSGGDRKRGTHLGEWANFRKALGLTKPADGDHGKEFDCVLLTGLEAAIASNLCASGQDANETAVQSRLGRLRHGSRGERVKRLERGLKRNETGIFNHAVLKAWTDRQRTDHGGRSTSVYEPAADQAYPAFGVFAPLPALVASASPSHAGSTFESVDGGASRDDLYRAIGIEQARNPGLAGIPSESGRPFAEGGLEAYEAFGIDAELLARGRALVRFVEGKLHQQICGNPTAPQSLAQAMRGRLDTQAQGSTERLQKYLATAIRVLVAKAIVLPEDTANWIASAIIDTLTPAAVAAGDAFSGTIEQAGLWLCRQWAQRLGGAAAAPAAPAAPSGPLGAPAVQPAASPSLQPAATTAARPAAATAAAPATTAAVAPSGKVGEILRNIEGAAKADPPDAAGLRRYMLDLNRHLLETDDGLDPNEAERLVNVICTSPLIYQMSDAAADPYERIRLIETDLRKSPADKTAARAHLAELHAMLADARIKLQPEEVSRLLGALKSARMYDEMAHIADRLAARDPAAAGQVATIYAQGLIDGGRILAGISLLEAAERDKWIDVEEIKNEALALRGRGHKQMYVNHVRTPSDAAALRDTLGPMLLEAIDLYGRLYDPARPGENFYQGINYIALLKRAERDGMKVEGKAAPDALARAMIAALEPESKSSTNRWLQATLAEAYLAAGDNENAARLYAAFAKDADAFALNSALRQLEEVWQISAAASGQGAIVMNLKAVLASKENGHITLASDERQAIKTAKVESVQFHEHFETVTAGGGTMFLALLQTIVNTASAVAAVQKPLDPAGRTCQTVGTAFLVNGADFSPDLPPDKTYLLTNAHVMWDSTMNGGDNREMPAVSHEAARIVFDTGNPQSGIYQCGKVHWQSPRQQYDCVLFELKGKADISAKPLTLAPYKKTLAICAPDAQGGDAQGQPPPAGTRIAVLGYPNGGPLSIGVRGNLNEMRGSLVDMGCKTDRTEPIFLHYLTPTEGGNSGSPVFDAENWTVVALHHMGFLRGSDGLPKLAGKSGFNPANEGIHIDSIREAVRAALAPPPPAPEPERRRSFFGRKG